MILRFAVLIFFLQTIQAKINIEISAGKNAEDVTITHSGYESQVVTEDEIEQFGIDDKTLLQAVTIHYKTKPKNVYLKSPTPWGDLYKTYNWEEVTRVLTVKSATFKNVVKKPVIVMSQDFDNVSNNTIKVNTGMSQTVENTVTTSWSKNNEFTVSQEIEYGLNVMVAKATGTTGFSYTSNWGQSEEKSETITIGTTSSMETELKPGQAATAVLSATRGYLEIEVEYVAKLRGYVAVNFKRKFRDHHFWFPPIDKVMKSAGLQNERTAVETINIGYYTDASLKVYDKESGLPL